MKYFKDQDFKINGTFLDFEGAIKQVISYCQNNNIKLNRHIKNCTIIYSGENQLNLTTCSLEIKPGLDILDFYKICIRMCTAKKNSYGKSRLDWENSNQGYFMQTMLEEILAQNIFLYHAVDKEKAEKYIKTSRKHFAEEISLLERICLQLNIHSPIKLFNFRNTNNQLRNIFKEKYEDLNGLKGTWDNIEKNLDLTSMYKHSPNNKNDNKANTQFEKTSALIDNIFHNSFSQSYVNPNSPPMPVSNYLDNLTQNNRYKTDKTNGNER